MIIIDRNVLEHDIAGLELSRLLRRIPATVVPICVGGQEAKDVLLVLEAHDDEHVGKHFDLRELTARLSALVSSLPERRAPVDRRMGLPPTSGPKSKLVAGPIAVDLTKQAVLVHGKRVEVTKTQFLLLVYLVQRIGRFVSQQELREHVLRTTALADSSGIRNHVCKLKNRLGSAGVLIQSERGAGYRIRTHGELIVAKK